MKHYCEDIEAVLRETDSKKEGLSTSEAARRLEQNGKNRLADAKKDSLVMRFFAQMADPMIIILLVAAIVSAATSLYAKESFADVIIIITVVIINSVLGVYQESKAERAIEALQEMASATSKVLRDGHIAVLKSEELVVGDIVLLEAGDAVPADGRLIECNSLQVEEAALTGESVPVQKMINILMLADTEDVPLGDRNNMVYMGSSIAYGRGVAVITATGMGTQMGMIADALSNAETGQTPLQIKLSQLSKTLTYLVVGICAAIFAVGAIRAGKFTADVMLDSFMVAVSLAVAAIPEGLAAVVTVVLSIGVTNMSKRNAIIRRLTAVETLGCAQIICSDKTGTLTQNKMTVVEHYASDERLLAMAMSLCSDAELDAHGVATGEPTECSLVEYAKSLGLPKNELRISAPRIGEAPFDSLRKMMTTVHDFDGKITQFTKGAPDEVLKLCTHFFENGTALPMTDTKREEILQANRDMANRALRVLLASVRFHAAPPTDYTPAALEKSLCFVGLTGMIDPVRPEVKSAILECRSAGIRPIMITGDHIDTATAIAKELGILDGYSAITGSKLDAMDDEEFEQRFMDISVYARVQPEHKVRIVKAWRAAGYVTAMTGDGVNDAPSIKTADIGVGMGITGTDVTKNVADMVLADDNFATIVGAVEEGRRVYDNIRKAIQFLIGSNMSEVLAVFSATLMGFTILKPVHLLWINLLTDTFPALALGLEPAESNIMRRKPRSAHEGIFANGLGVDVAYQGVMVAALTMFAYFIGHFLETGIWEFTNSADGMTMAFLTMSMAEICHSFNMRSQRGSLLHIKKQNKALILAAVGSLALTTIVIYVPFLAQAFGFTDISAMEYVIALALAICTIPLVEVVKYLQRAVTER